MKTFEFFNNKKNDFTIIGNHRSEQPIIVGYAKTIKQAEYFTNQLNDFFEEYANQSKCDVSDDEIEKMIEPFRGKGNFANCLDVEDAIFCAKTLRDKMKPLPKQPE